jgi:glycosyltransferase involved in cell wall biosynthesis
MVERPTHVTAGVWFLTELFYPNQTSTGHIMTRIAEHVAREADVTVICGPEKYGETQHIACTKLHPRVVVVRVAVRDWDKNRLPTRIIGSALLTLKLAASLMRRASRGDTVVAVTNPATLLPVAAAICRLRGLRLIVIVHDVFPENLVAAHILTFDSFRYRLLRRLFDSAYASADRLLVLGRDMRDLLHAKTRLPTSERITVIENWAETEVVYPLAREPEERLRLQFAGNLGRVQGLLTLLEAIRCANNPNVAVDFVGGGALRGEMEKFLEQNGLRQVRILPPFQRARQLEVLNNCDIGIVSLGDAMLGVGVPSKAYNILAAGKPILFIGDPRSEIAQLVAESGVGWVFADYGEPLVTFLRSLGHAMRPQLALMGQKARHLAETRYAEARQLDAYRAVIRDR